MHACACMCINTTSSSTATALLQGVFSIQFCTRHSAWFPSSSRTLLLCEALQSKCRLKSAFFPLLWLFTTLPTAEQTVMNSPISTGHSWESSEHNKGRRGRSQRHSGSIRSHAKDCVSWLYCPGTCFSSNPVKVIDTILPILQWQVAFLEA